MSNVIPFRKRKPEPENVQVTVQGSGGLTFGDCTEVVHYFDETPGVCHCGKTRWEPPNDPEDNLTSV